MHHRGEGIARRWDIQCPEDWKYWRERMCQTWWRFHSVRVWNRRCLIVKSFCKYVAETSESVYRDI